MLKILFVTCFYNRPKISKLYLLGLKRLKKIYNFDILVCCSDNESIKLCNEFDIKYITYTNIPLGVKHNELFNYALTKDFDYLIHSGDDDILSDKGFLKLLELIKDGKEYICHTNLYFYDTESKNGVKFVNDMPMGAFRVFKRSILEDYAITTKVQFKRDFLLGDKEYLEGCEYLLPNKIANYYVEKGICAKAGDVFRLYPNKINTGLDFASHCKLLECGVKPTIVSDCEIVDVKSSQNIWGFTKLSSKGYSVDTKEIFELMGEAELTYLNSL